MFRPMRRQKQALSYEECLDVLKNETRCVIAVNGDEGYPYATVVNHWYNEENGRIYFHSGKIGYRVDALKKDEKVCLSLHDAGYRREGEWALNVRSVIIFGRARLVADEKAAMAAARQLCYKFTQDEAYIADEIARSGKNTLVYEITIEHMTGKIVNEA